MEITRETLKHVAETARLNLSEKEIDEFLPQLKEILDYFETIAKAKTEDVKPSFQPIELKNVMRDDKEKESLSQHDALSNAENKKEGYFLGPRAV